MLVIKRKVIPCQSHRSFLLSQRNHQLKPYLHPQTPLLTWNPNTGLQQSTYSVLLQMEMVVSITFLYQPFSLLSLFGTALTIK